LIKIYLVNRVHWLRARAQRQRWQEELILVEREMEWTVRYYLHQSGVWTERRRTADDIEDRGAAVYAARKIDMWRNMAASASVQFLSVNPRFKLPKT
jgi:hypothetical protein